MKQAIYKPYWGNNRVVRSCLLGIGIFAILSGSISLFKNGNSIFSHTVTPLYFGLAFIIFAVVMHFQNSATTPIVMQKYSLGLVLVSVLLITLSVFNILSSEATECTSRGGEYHLFNSLLNSNSRSGNHNWSVCTRPDGSDIPID
jgi:hypothetical protein